MTEIHSNIEAAVSELVGRRCRLPEFSFEPLGEAFDVQLDGRTLRVAYVAADPWPPANFWGEHGERGAFRRFRVASTRDRFLRRLESDGGYAFDVEHGPDRLRVRPLGKARAAIGVYALPDELAVRVRSGAITVPRAMAEADATMRDYSAWSSGEACGVVIERFTVGARSISAVEHDAQWVVASEDRAAAMVSEALGRAAEAGFRP